MRKIGGRPTKLLIAYDGSGYAHGALRELRSSGLPHNAKRFMDAEHKETWIGKMRDYREMNGITIPTKVEVVWKLKKGEFSYAKFSVKKIEYDRPEKF
jgi:hypothetical protein